MIEARALGPAQRSRPALRMSAAATLGRFELQQCEVCQTVQYPPREACRRCLSPALGWTLQTGTGELLSQTTLFHSHDPYFRGRLPWRVGLVQLDTGPEVIAHVHAAVAPPPGRVRVRVRLDKTGQAALVAMPPAKDVAMIADKGLCDLTWDPQGRRVLVTDGTTALGTALTRQLLKCGAKAVWAGYGGERKPAATSGVKFVPLDVRDARSVGRAAAELGLEVDILINNAEVKGTGGGLEAAQEEMDVNYFGLLRLAEHFGPRLRSRSGTGDGAVAWVNVLSVCALMSSAAQATYSASQAAALSLSQGLRATMRPAGVRVMNVFHGPMAATHLATAILTALRDTVEEVYPGAVAQRWLAGWLENSKLMERELALRP